MEQVNIIEQNKDSGVVNRIIDGISGIFLPIVNLLSATGILKGVLAIFTGTGLLSAESETYLVLNAMADSLFYFLPILLAATSAKKFGADVFTAVVIAGVLLYPSLTMALESGETIHFFGIPLRSVTYHSSVIPIILATGMLSFVERGLHRILPDMIEGFLKPLLSILLVSFATLLLFGPIGAVTGDLLAEAYEYIYRFSPAVAGALLGALIQPMVIFGFHWSFILIGMNNIQVSGHDTVLALIAPPVFAQAGAALAVMVKSKDKAFRSICASAALSALFGITEPAMFGVNLPRKTPLVVVCVVGGIGGAIVGLSGAQAMAFAFPSLASLPVFYGKGFWLLLASCIASFIAAFVLTLCLKYKDPLLAERVSVGTED